MLPGRMSGVARDQNCEVSGITSKPQCLVGGAAAGGGEGPARPEDCRSPCTHPEKSRERPSKEVDWYSECFRKIPSPKRLEEGTAQIRRSKGLWLQLDGT